MNVKEQIFDCFRNPDIRLVFGTQTLCDLWTEYYVSENSGKAVFSDRTMSWDSFCDMLTDHDGLESADDTDRLSFAYSILCNDVVFKSLHYFSSPSFPESKHAFAGNISSLLPSFARIEELKDKPGTNTEMISDVNLISGEYRKFLRENGLYERQYLPKHMERATENYVIVFPQLCSDPDISLILSNGACAVINLPDCPDYSVFNLYDNSVSEIKDTIRRISFLLNEKGVMPSDIAITCSSSDTYRPYLEKEAASHDVRLAFTSRLLYTDYPQGRFFVLLFRMYSENFSFESVRSFLLEPSFPFVSPHLNRLIVSTGVKYKVTDGTIKAWNSVLGYRALTCPENEKSEVAEAASFFREMSSFVCKLCTEKDPLVCISLFEEFRDSFIDSTLSFGRNDMMLGSCLEIFSRIARRQAMYGESVFRVFLDILSYRTYVEKIGDGIRVYSYPVSAAVPVKYHFVMGLDEKTAAVPVNRYPFVRDVSPVSESITANVLAAYSNSFFSPQIRLSGSETGFDGARTVPAQLSGHEEKQNETLPDSFAAEHRIWNGEKSDIRPSDCQRRSFENASEVIIKSDCMSRIFPNLKDRKMGISASSFRSFSKCHFMGFAEFVLGLSASLWDVVDPDPMAVGNIIHHTLEKSLEIDNITQINEGTLVPILSEEIKHCLEKHTLGNKISAIHLEQKYSKLLLSISKAASDSEIKQSAELECNEKRLTPYHVPGLENVTIRGTADTILRDGNCYYLIDYKTSGDSDYGTSPQEISPQIAVYSRILDISEGKNIVWSAYYSVSKEKMLLVWPRVQGSRSERGYDRDQIYQELDKKLDELKVSVTESDFAASASDKVCIQCPFGSLCRRRFSAR